MIQIGCYPSMINLNAKGLNSPIQTYGLEELSYSDNMAYNMLTGKDVEIENEMERYSMRMATKSK